jgi:hypothetical protein
MAWTQAFAFAAWIVLSGGVASASAEMRCALPDANGVRACSAGLPSGVVKRMQVPQQRSQWCWAASLEMVFARYGYAVPQAEIVERWYGDELDLPIWTKDVPQLVGRDWFDVDGKGFSALAVPKPVSRPTLAGFRQVLQTLADEHPLLLVTGRHVVVLVGLKFESYADGGLRITGGMVLDPAPAQGLRELGPGEVHPALLAQVRIRPRPAHFTSVTELSDPEAAKGAPGQDPSEASRLWGVALARGDAEATDDALIGRSRYAED